ncbi:hypothetical protein J437_LFUL012353 [Ladona fulva]|uniref:Peptidoglycan recognition protein family domain-containing protein n=1 Tax=Ladona fulva TaxID=123851 RepID=A0A8K0K1B8_LADFU|nr:hypothetical protein J437_LFUL012353 [Ladona fulva]
MTLLVLLTWYLLCLTFIASSLALLSLLLWEKNSKFSKWSSWIAFALGCLAVLTVVITAGYLGMRFRLRSAIAEPCVEFGMKNNPQSNSENVPDIALVLNYLLSEFPEVTKWASWFALTLCAFAVFFFVIFLAVLLKEDEKLRNKIPPMKAKKAFAYKSFHDYEDGDIKIISGKYGKLRPGSLKRESSLSLLNYATFGLLSAAVIWVLLLNYYVSQEEERIVPLCAPMDSPVEDPLIQDHQNHTMMTTRRLFLVPREQWSADPPRQTTTLQHPVEHVVVSYTYGEPCSSRYECTEVIKHLQKLDMDGKGWWDILQNFLVAGDNRVYEGRGWDVEGLPKDQYVNGSLLFSFVGRFMHELPPQHQLRTLRKLVDEGVRLGKISSLYKLVVDHKAVGSILEKELQTWDHYFLGE